MSNSDVKERAVVITGATKGLGKELSLAFAGAGHELIGLYQSDASSAESFESEFRAKKLHGVFIRQDITEDGEWTEFDWFVEKNRNKRFTLISSASPKFTPKPFHLYDWTEFTAQLDVNVKGSLNILRRILPNMLNARSGTFITVLSSSLKTFPKGFAAYLTAKSALEGLTKAAAAEYSNRGLRIFSVSPGFMKTPLTDSWSDHLKTSIESTERLIHSPYEVAQKILALAKDPRTKGNGENYCLDSIP